MLGRRLLPNAKTWLAAPYAIVIAAGVLLAQPGYAEDGTTATPTSAQSEGGSTSSGSSSSSSPGKSTSVASDQNSGSATVDTGSGTAAAQDQTSGSATSSQATGDLTQPDPPTPAPSVHATIHNGKKAWNNDGGRRQGKWRHRDDQSSGAALKGNAAGPRHKQFNPSSSNTPKTFSRKNSSNTPKTFARQNKTSSKTKPPRTTIATVPTPHGTGQATAAGAATQASAEAHNEGTKPVSNASASAQAGGIAIEATDTGPIAVAKTESTDPESTDPSVSIALTGSESSAKAHAEGGDAPTAYAEAGSDIYAEAIGGADKSATAKAGEGAIEKSLNTGNEVWAIAYVAGGQYSVAVATDTSAKAYSSTYGAGNAFTVDDVWAAALTWATAYAEANNYTALAWADAGAQGSAGTTGGMSVAASASHASAQIRIELHHPGSSAGSGGSASIECHLTVTDLEHLKKVRPEERIRYMSCACPIGWHNAPGKDSYACIPNTVQEASFRKPRKK